MKLLNRLDRAIVIQLGQSAKGLNAFTLSRRLRVSPAELVKAYLRLGSAGLVVVDGSHIELTSAGRQVVVSQSLQDSSQDRNWRKVPDEYRREPVQLNQPIVPWLPLVHRSIVSTDVRKRLESPRKID